MEDKLEEFTKKSDPLGGVVELRIENLPAGVGETVFDRLDALLARGIISIPAVVGVEFGLGFQGVSMINFHKTVI